MLFHAIMSSHSTIFAVQSGQQEELEEGLQVTINETSSPAGLEGYAIGETLSWTVVIHSTGSALSNVLVQVTGMDNRTTTVPKRGTRVLTYSRTVTPADVNAEGISITASVSATINEEQLSGSDTLTADTVDPYVDLSLSFTEVNPLPEGTLYQSGDSISWSFTVSNTGSIDLSGASLEIFCNGLTLNSYPSINFAAGSSSTTTGTFTVRDADAALGEVSFSAVFKEPIVDGVEKPAWKAYMDIENIDTDVQMSWRYIVNTTLLSSSNKTTAVPIRLYGLSNVSCTVDWGDSSTTTLTPADYTNTSSAIANHTYASTGTYTVTVSTSASNWSSMRLMSCSTNNTSASGWNGKTLPIYYFRNTVKEILDPIPPIAGVSQFSAVKPGSGTEGTATNHSFAYLFYSSKLTTICDGLFSLNQNATSFQGTFYNSLLAGAIPLTTFYGCNQATSYDHCFYGSKVTSIASGVFNWAEGVTDFSYLFYGSPLQTMGAGLFANSPLVTSFWSAWKNCTSLTALPANLFAYTPLAMNFQSVFAVCSKISSVAADTFASCTQATDFQQAFEKCTSLTAIPQGFFSVCTEVTNFKSVFNGSSKIATIPDDLFQYNTKVTSFESSFAGCSSLGNFDLVIGSQRVSIATSFCPKKTGAVRTVTVPASSTTATTFNGVASGCGLTIIEASE